MSHKGVEKAATRLRFSRRGMGVPVTFMTLFVSLTLVTLATYHLGLVRINAEGSELEILTAKQAASSADDLVGFVAWSPGSREVGLLKDFGGWFWVDPEGKGLVIKVTGGDLSDTVFNSTVGEVVLELAPARAHNSYYLRGDSRVILNLSSSTMTGMRLAPGERSQEITLCYRPLASSSLDGWDDGGRPLNSLRVYVISLNSSQSLSLRGDFYLEAACVDVVSVLRSYNLTSQVDSLTVEADLGGIQGAVSVPVSSSPEGATVNVETVICGVQLQRV